MMRIVVSPYHLTTREAPAMAALLLGEEIVTLLPAGPKGGRAGASNAAEQSLAYRELVRSWAWAEELWRSGRLTGEIAGKTAVTDVRDAAAAISDDERFAPLRALMHDRLFEYETAYLNALASDILKGGPDPGITVPVATGLDRFAARNGAFVARAHPSSVAQRAEQELMQDRVTLVLPVLLQADASRILVARDLLRAPLATLRAAIAGCESERGGATGIRADDLQSAAAAYAVAFASTIGRIGDGCTDDDVKMVAGDVAMTCSTLPADAVLRSSLSALAAVSRTRRLAERGSADPALMVSGGRAVSALTFKVLGGAR